MTYSDAVYPPPIVLHHHAGDALTLSNGSPSNDGDHAVWQAEAILTLTIAVAKGDKHLAPIVAELTRYLEEDMVAEARAYTARRFGRYDPEASS